MCDEKLREKLRKNSFIYQLAAIRSSYINQYALAYSTNDGTDA
jgi:hypothetical protein